MTGAIHQLENFTDTIFQTKKNYEINTVVISFSFSLTDNIIYSILDRCQEKISEFNQIN